MLLFSTVEHLFDGNQDLLNQLQDTLTKDKPPLIGKVFLEMIDTLCQYYGVFCNHQKECMDTIEENLKKNAGKFF